MGVDQGGTIVQINAQTEALFGYTQEELIGKKVEILIPERHMRGTTGIAPTSPKTPG